MSWLELLVGAILTQWLFQLIVVKSETVEHGRTFKVMHERLQIHPTCFDSIIIVRPLAIG